MNWDEVRVRVGQEFHKQSDLLMHRMGVRNGSIRLNSDSAARRGQFFFSASEFSGSEISERAELLRKHLPDEAAEILREADEICGHRFRLLGYENLEYGSEIDWHLDLVHGKRAPMDPWFKIPFLDFAVVGDHKVTWELNRHQHLVTLAKAGLLSGRQRQREVRPRTDGAVAQLDQGESVSVGDQLGKHAGGCLPQFVVDMGGPVAGGSG